MMRWPLALLLALCCAVSPAMACSPFIADFPDQVSRPGQMVVIGRYVADPATDRDASSQFVVDEVLSGTLRRGRYRLVMEGPWGSLCEVSVMESTGSVGPEDNPVVLLVESQIDAETLNLSFSRERARLADGKLTAVRTYVGRFDGGPDNEFRRLDQPEVVQADLEAFKAWLPQRANGAPAPWKVVPDANWREWLSR